LMKIQKNWNVSIQESRRVTKSFLQRHI